MSVLGGSCDVRSLGACWCEPWSGVPGGGSRQTGTALFPPLGTMHKIAFGESWPRAER